MYQILRGRTVVGQHSDITHSIRRLCFQKAFQSSNLTSKTSNLSESIYVAQILWTSNGTDLVWRKEKVVDIEPSEKKEISQVLCCPIPKEDHVLDWYPRWSSCVEKEVSKYFATFNPKLKENPWLRHGYFLIKMKRGAFLHWNKAQENEGFMIQDTPLEVLFVDWWTDDFNNNVHSETTHSP